MKKFQIIRIITTSYSRMVEDNEVGGILCQLMQNELLVVQGLGENIVFPVNPVCTYNQLMSLFQIVTMLIDRNIILLFLVIGVY